MRAWNVALFDPNGERLAVGDATWSQALGQDNDSWGLIQGGSASNPGTRWSNVSLADPSLVVVRLDHNAGATDTAYLWVNPSLAAEPSTASAQATTTGDFTFNQIRLFAGNPNPVGAQGVVDELRVGQTWFDVTPVPEPGEWSVVTGVLLLATGGYWGLFDDGLPTPPPPEPTTRRNPVTRRTGIAAPAIGWTPRGSRRRTRGRCPRSRPASCRFSVR